MPYVKHFSVHLSLGELLVLLPRDFVDNLCSQLHVSRSDFRHLDVFESAGNPSTFIIHNSVEILKDGERNEE